MKVRTMMLAAYATLLMLGAAQADTAGQADAPVNMFGGASYQGNRRWR